MTDESEPNKTWRYDFLTFPTTAGDFHCVPVLDACSRKITGRYFGPEETSASVHSAWDKALANEGLLGEDAPQLPMAASDRGTQMTSKSTQQFFFDLVIVQSFSRPKTPTDNAACESWIATFKCERLYDANTADMEPWEASPCSTSSSITTTTKDCTKASATSRRAERHDGRHVAIIEARKSGMQEAKERRRMEAYRGVRETR